MTTEVYSNPDDELFHLDKNCPHATKPVTTRDITSTVLERSKSQESLPWGVTTKEPCKCV